MRPRPEQKAQSNKVRYLAQRQNLAQHLGEVALAIGFFQQLEFIDAVEAVGGFHFAAGGQKNPEGGAAPAGFERQFINVS